MIMFLLVFKCLQSLGKTSMFAWSLTFAMILLGVLIFGLTHAITADIQCKSCTTPSDSDDCALGTDANEVSGPACYTKTDGSSIYRGACASSDCSSEVKGKKIEIFIYTCFTDYCNVQPSTFLLFTAMECLWCVSGCTSSSSYREAGLPCYALLLNGEVKQGGCSKLDCSDKFTAADNILLTSVASGNTQVAADFSDSYSCYTCSSSCDNAVDITQNGLGVLVGKACISGENKNGDFLRDACNDVTCSEKVFTLSKICTGRLCNALSKADSLAPTTTTVATTTIEATTTTMAPTTTTMTPTTLTMAPITPTMTPADATTKASTTTTAAVAEDNATSASHNNLKAEKPVMSFTVLLVFTLVGGFVLN